MLCNASHYHSLSSSSQIHGNTFSYFGVCIFVKLRQYIAIYWRHRCLNRRQCNLLAEAQNRKYGATPLNNLRQKHLRTKNDCQHHSPDRNFKIIKVIRMRIVMMMMMLMMIINLHYLMMIHDDEEFSKYMNIYSAG